MYFANEYGCPLLLFFTRAVLSARWCFDFTLKDGLTDRRPTSYLLASFRCQRLTGCVSQCAFNVSCTSFFFSQSEGQCSLLANKMSAVTFEMQGGWTGYDFPGREPAVFIPEGYTCSPSASLCYKLHTVVKSWSGARLECQKENADLAILNTDTRKSTIEGYAVTLTEKDDTFLGGTYNNGWKWINGTTNVQWLSGVPGENTDCLEMKISNSDVSYDSSGCGREQWFLCGIPT